MQLIASFYSMAHTLMTSLFPKFHVYGALRSLFVASGGNVGVVLLLIRPTSIDCLGWLLTLVAITCWVVLVGVLVTLVMWLAREVECCDY